MNLNQNFINIRYLILNLLLVKEFLMNYNSFIIHSYLNSTILISYFIKNHSNYHFNY